MFVNGLYIYSQTKSDIESNSTFDLFRQMWLNYFTSTHTNILHLAAITNVYILVSYLSEKSF